MRSFPSCAVLLLACACNDDSGSESTEFGALSPDGSVETPAECESDQKLCFGECVQTDDPDVGCGGPSCSPCNFDNANATCSSDGACAMDACQAGFFDCDGQPHNGCESDPVNDRRNCEICGNLCNFEHGRGECSSESGCTLLVCDPGWTSCSDRGEVFVGLNGDMPVEATTGEDCETDITSPDNCGGCGIECDANEVCTEDLNLETWRCEPVRSGATDAGSDAG